MTTPIKITQAQIREAQTLFNLLCMEGMDKMGFVLKHSEGDKDSIRDFTKEEAISLIKDLRASEKGKSLTAMRRKVFAILPELGFPEPRHVEYIAESEHCVVKTKTGKQKKWSNFNIEDLKLFIRQLERFRENRYAKLVREGNHLKFYRPSNVKSL